MTEKKALVDTRGNPSTQNTENVISTPEIALATLGDDPTQIEILKNEPKIEIINDNNNDENTKENEYNNNETHGTNEANPKNTDNIQHHTKRRGILYVFFLGFFFFCLSQQISAICAVY